MVDAAAAAAAPSPLAVGAVLLAAAWAAAPVVACASSSLQAVSCLGASVLSFQLRWPLAAPAKPKPPPPLETAVTSPNIASARVRGSAPLARSNPFPLTERAARAWDRHYRSGRGAPCRGGRRGRDGPTAAALADPPRAGPAARTIAARRDPQRAIAACSATDALPQAPPLHMPSCHSCLAGQSLGSAARNITKVQNTSAHKHTNTETTPRWCRLPARVLCGAGTAGGVASLQRTRACVSPRMQASSDTLTRAWIMRPHLLRRPPHAARLCRQRRQLRLRARRRQPWRARRSPPQVLVPMWAGRRTARRRRGGRRGRTPTAQAAAPRTEQSVECSTYPSSSLGHCEALAAAFNAHGERARRKGGVAHRQRLQRESCGRHGRYDEHHH